LGEAYVNPNDVNFYGINTREIDSLSVATGSYNPSHHNQFHGGYPMPDRASEWVRLLIKNHSDADGTKMSMQDEIYSGYPSTMVTGAAPPFNVGAYHWDIPWQWKVGTGAAKNFPTNLLQTNEIFIDGKCVVSKDGHSEFSMYDDPDSAPDGWV
jgi:hypothetical protein